MVSEIKNAGLNVGVIVLIGVGGSRYFEPHVVETTDLLNALRLGKGDLVYFSPLWASPGSEYLGRSSEWGSVASPTKKGEIRFQPSGPGCEFAEGLKPKTALYDIREFIY